MTKANSADPDQTPQAAVSIRVFTVCLQNVLLTFEEKKEKKNTNIPKMGMGSSY